MSSVRFNPQPQRPAKKKKSLGEGADESRMARVSFKRYLRELEEQDDAVLDDEEDDDFERYLPYEEDKIEEMFKDFSEENPDLIRDAQKMPGPDKWAAEFLMNEIEVWLDKQGFVDTRDWMNGSRGEVLYNIILDSFF